MYIRQRGFVPTVIGLTGTVVTVYSLLVILKGLTFIIEWGYNIGAILVLLVFLLIICYAFWFISLFPDVIILENGIKYRVFGFLAVFIEWDDIWKVTEISSPFFLRGHFAVLLRQGKTSIWRMPSMMLKTLISRTEQPAFFISPTGQGLDLIKEINERTVDGSTLTHKV